MEFTSKTVSRCSYLDTLLKPIYDRFDEKERTAKQMPHNTVERNAHLGVLSGLERGCLMNARAICKSCYKSLHRMKPVIPKNALINDTWQGLIPPELQYRCEEHPKGLNKVEMSMVCLFCPISYMTILKGGTTFGAKQFTIAFLNNFEAVADTMGRYPSPELCAFLKREGVDSKDAKFRPAVVDRAISFLLQHNVVYANAWKDRKRIYIGKEGQSLEYEETLGDEFFLQMDETEVAAIDQVNQNDYKLSGDESEYVLYHSDATEDYVSRDDHTRMNLNAPPLASIGKKREFHLPRVNGEGLVHPSNDKLFYEKCFPCLFPYGLGGPNHGSHRIRFDDYVKLLLRRGGSHDARRFGKYIPFMLAVYSYKMKKISGGVAYIASMNVEAAGHSARGPSGQGGEARGNDSSLFEQIQNAPDAKSILEALQTNNGELAHRILRRLEPYAERLVGTPAFIMHERKLLYAMLGSHIVREYGVPGIFSTIAPNDRFYPELPDILNRGLQQRDDYPRDERVKMLRNHPVLAARLFEIRSRLFFKHVVNGEDKPLGELSDWWMRLEFQGRGTPHLHMILFLVLKDFFKSNILESSESFKASDAAQKYANERLSAWLEPPATPKNEEEAESAEYKMQLKPEYNPAFHEFDNCHPSSERTKWRDETGIWDYSIVGCGDCHDAKYVRKRKYADERVRLDQRKIILSNNMHRCCTTCYKYGNDCVCRSGFPFDVQLDDPEDEDYTGVAQMRARMGRRNRIKVTIEAARNNEHINRHASMPAMACTWRGNMDQTCDNICINISRSVSKLLSTSLQNNQRRTRGGDVLLVIRIQSGRARFAAYIQYSIEIHWKNGRIK